MIKIGLSRGKVTMSKAGPSAVPTFTVSVTVRAIETYDEAEKLLEDFLQSAGQKVIVPGQKRISQ